jgi:hypothetical protein
VGRRLADPLLGEPLEHQPGCRTELGLVEPDREARIAEEGRQLRPRSPASGECGVELFRSLAGGA